MSLIPPGSSKKLITVNNLMNSHDIDTSDFYGPHVTDQIIGQALHPYSRGR
jgi:hypothetical protein